MIFLNNEISDFMNSIGQHLFNFFLVIILLIYLYKCQNQVHKQI